MTANVNRDTKKRPTPYTPSDYNPFILHERKKAPAHTITTRQFFGLLKQGSKL